MTTEDKSQIPLFSPEDEKVAQKELKHLRKNENGVFKVNNKRTGFENKTLWDWLQLLGVLAIPLVVVGATILFGWWQGQLADMQHKQDEQSAKLQHAQDQQSALDQQQATILQTYIDNIQDLLLNHNLLGDSPMPKNDSDTVKIQEVRALARSRTLTALQGLDPKRKGLLVQFIYEAHLIGYLDSKNKLQHKIINLDGADLSFADFTTANLEGADLSSAYLFRADLSNIDLSGAALRDADLSFADLFYAMLFNVDLSNAKLFNVDLYGANLSNANLSNAYLSGAKNLAQQQLDQVSSCKDAGLPTGLTCHHNR